MLDLRRMRILREVALHGTIRSAAQALSFSPSAVSQQVSALERELGVRLLVRNGRGVRLTDAGRALVDRTETLLAQLAAAESEARALDGASAQTVRVAAFPSAAATIVADAVRGLDGSLTAAIVEADPTLGLARVRSSEVELALVWEYEYVPLTLPPGIEVEHLLDDPVHVLVPRGHRVGGKTAVELAHLGDERWINSTPLSSCHPFVPRACHAAGFTPQIAAETNDHRTLHELVASGVGLALVSRLSLLEIAPGVVAVPIAPPGLHRRIHAAFRRERRNEPALADMLSRLRAAAAGRSLA
jgi:molybdate transport repressor ModE-like protein